MIDDRSKLDPGHAWVHTTRDLYTGEKRLVVRLIIAKPHPDTIERHILTAPDYAASPVGPMVVQKDYHYTVIEPRVGTK